MESPQPSIHFETYGQGTALILSHPFRASATPGDPERRILRGYIERLPHCRVVVMDYPNGRGSEPVPADELTVERACKDMLHVADLARLDRFVWWGYSWGSVLGLQLATCTERVAALICGGWSPLGGLHVDLLQGCRALAGTPAQTSHSLTFYESLRNWPEAQSVAKISCPKMVYAGSEDELERGGVKIPIAGRLRAQRRRLEAGGWEVHEITGRDHSVWTDPDAVFAAVRGFLDRVT